MDASSAATSVHLCTMPGSNKVPRFSRWWVCEDVLRFHAFQLAMELLLRDIRPLPISARCTVHDYYACRWHLQSTLLVWQEAWSILQPSQRVEYIKRTYDLDAQFGASMVDFAYAVQIGSGGNLWAMD